MTEARRHRGPLSALLAIDRPNLHFQWTQVREVSQIRAEGILPVMSFRVGAADRSTSTAALRAAVFEVPLPPATLMAFELRTPITSALEADDRSHGPAPPGGASSLRRSLSSASALAPPRPSACDRDRLDYPHHRTRHTVVRSAIWDAGGGVPWSKREGPKLASVFAPVCWTLPQRSTTIVPTHEAIDPGDSSNCPGAVAKEL
jgi:hypothetical protein